MDFSEALMYLRHGYAVAREGWNGKGMFLFLFRPAGVTMMIDPRRPRPSFRDTPYISQLSPPAIAVTPEPHIMMFTADAKFVPWLASQTDLLAEDWESVEAPGA